MINPTVELKIIASRCWDHNCSEPDTPPWFNYDKFAELLIKECLERMIPSPNSDEYYSTLESAIRVKKYFGVK